MATSDCIYCSTTWIGGVAQAVAEEVEAELGDKAEEAERRVAGSVIAELVLLPGAHESSLWLQKL